MKPKRVRTMRFHKEPTETTLRILATIRRIPRGWVASYGDIAAAAGLPGRARLVGHVLRVEPLASGVPWHRVVGASGRLSIPNDAGRSEQRRKLLREGVKFLGPLKVDMRRCRWRRVGSSAGR